MNLWELNDRELSDAHSETLKKAQAARAADDMDLAQRYIRILGPMNAEIALRIRKRRESWTHPQDRRAV